MSIAECIIFLFAVYGLQKIISEGKPMEPFRNVCVRLSGGLAIRFFKCPLCVGFWAGAILAVYLILMPDNIEIYPLMPFMGAGICRFLSDLTYFAHLGDIEDPERSEEVK